MNSIKKNRHNPIVALSLVFLLTACEQKFPPDSPEYVVQALYSDSATKGIPRDRAALSRYFDGRLTELLLNDFNCIGADGKSCGLLYFDPVAQTKEPDITDLKLFKPEESNDVLVDFMQNGAEYKAICAMVKTRDGWRVSDIIYYGANQILDPGASVMTYLSMQTPLPPPWHPTVPGMSPEELEKLHL
ncbi:MAG TPA: hypothetical protein VFX02_13500 [Gammaproteobacteria bacterium]|nr:hypothetical protein [Gammaproteobacteria bacterium]